MHVQTDNEAIALTAIICGNENVQILIRIDSNRHHSIVSFGVNGFVFSNLRTLLVLNILTSFYLAPASAPVVHHNNSVIDKISS